ncbi:MAG: hypothetical protein JOZ24_07370 [Candidatus Eremiobacteraeota bacterium]|nr:hypothetical protein [Candidatus Eremiobacteraeota bacterium]
MTRTVTLPSPKARANVADALAGPGGPAGVLEVREEGETLTVRFDDAVSSCELVDDLVAIESVFVPTAVEPEWDFDQAAEIAAAGLGDPELDGSRILERYLRGGDRRR